MNKVIIIGSGPAGVSASLYSARAGLDTTIISKGIGSLENAHKIQNYYGIKGEISGKDLAVSGIKGAKNVGVNIINEEVVAISYDGNFIIETDKSKYFSEYAVIATGNTRNAPAIKNLKNLEGKGISYCAVCDAFFYRNKDVAVLGNGKFALHEIQDILPVASSVTLLTNGEKVKDMPPKEVKIKTEKITEILGNDSLEGVRFSDNSVIDIKGLFIAYGTAGSTALAKKIGAGIKGNYIAVNENMETSIKKLYAAGDCTGGMMQIAKAVYEGAVAGNHIVKESRKKQ